MFINPARYWMIALNCNSVVAIAACRRIERVLDVLCQGTPSRSGSVAHPLIRLARRVGSTI
jgi:hypothetical protein